MKQIITAAIAVLAIAIFTQSAFAGPRNNRVGRTEGRQMHRINQGVRSGELTRGEAKELRQEQHAINQKRKEAKRDDGKIDKEELKDIRKDQVEASKNIHEEKHDGEQRQ